MSPGRSFSGLVLDPEECSRLSLGKKRELVHEIAQWSLDAPAVLSSFSRKELIEIVCAEMGRERKFSGRSKTHMIQRLLKLVSRQTVNGKSDKNIDSDPAKLLSENQRQKQKESQDVISVPLEDHKEGRNTTRVCQNVACGATLCPGDAFCKRCSCCICHFYDDNKDPSLWLTCGSDSLGENSCGLTCHLACALKDERCGIMTKCDNRKLDGSFYCVACGNENGMTRTWKKQLSIAKEARRVDVLCLRVLLGYRILTGTKKYNEMQKILETALDKLKNELGPLDLVCSKMARGIVNRLSCGAEVQNLCASALEAFDSVYLNIQNYSLQKKEPITCIIRIKERLPTLVAIEVEHSCDQLEDFIGCMIWHRKSTSMDYLEKPTLVILKPDNRFRIDNLAPSTEYVCKASLFGNGRILCVHEAKWTTLSSNGSIGSESCRIKYCSSKRKLSLGDESGFPVLVGGGNKNADKVFHLSSSSSEAASLTESLSPSTPCKSNPMQEVLVLSCKKNEESAYEYCVRAVKWLEHTGHIDEEFRVKFLTWFSLKATTRERRVVNAYVDTMCDDPQSLAGQIIHTFAEIRRDEKLFPADGVCCRHLHWDKI